MAACSARQAGRTQACLACERADDFAASMKLDQESGE
jgi:hypothetical protein